MYARHAHTHVHSHVNLYVHSCALRHSLQFRIPVYLLVIATRKRKRNSRSSPDDLSLSVDYHRACANASTDTQRNARHACVSLVLLESCTTRHLTHCLGLLSAWYPLPVHPRKSFTCSIETQDYQKHMYVRMYVGIKFPHRDRLFVFLVPRHVSPRYVSGNK